MPKVPIGAVSLTMLSDGIVGRMLDAELDKINRDLIDRGHDGQPRKLKIEIVMKPTSGNLVVKARAKAELPPMESTPTIAKYDQRAGGFLFNTDCADNPDQQTIPGTTDHE